MTRVEIKEFKRLLNLGNIIFFSFFGGEEARERGGGGGGRQMETNGPKRTLLTAESPMRASGTHQPGDQDRS